jgi:hypothetical protein
VQFQLNGVNVGNPASVANGVATLTTAVDGNVGSSNLFAFYEGDSTYAEVTSASIPITVSPFGLTSPGTTAAAGSAALASVSLNVATNYTSPINLTCTLPSNLTESACFVNPSSMTGSGTLQLTVNTTPAHPAVSQSFARAAWLAECSAGFTAVVLLILPRRRWRNPALAALFLLTIFTVAGCNNSSGKTDPGTAKGTYTIVVTGTAGSGTSAYQTNVSVPITIE